MVCDMVDGGYRGIGLDGCWKWKKNKKKRSASITSDMQYGVETNRGKKWYLEGTVDAELAWLQNDEPRRQNPLISNHSTLDYSRCTPSVPLLVPP